MFPSLSTSGLISTSLGGSGSGSSSSSSSLLTLSRISVEALSPAAFIFRARRLATLAFLAAAFFSASSAILA
jgi:hypothetical protein